MAATAGTLASPGTIAYLLKRVYSPREVENAVYKDNPLLALIPKATGFTGESHIHAVRYRDQLARNSDFASAQGTTTDGSRGVLGASKGVQFIVGRVKNYQIYTLETEAILAGRDDKGSLMRVLTTEVDSALNNIGRDTAKMLYGDGYGSLGQVVSTTSVTVVVGEAITNFENGMILQAAPTSSSTDLRDSTVKTMTIDSIDRAAGSFTVATAVITGLAAGDFLFISKDRGITATAEKNKIVGLEGWNPVTAPAALESFFGVDRSVDKTRLGGLRLDISSLNPEEGLITALALAAREGAAPGHFFSSFTDVKNIHLALGSKVETEFTQVGDIGFTSIRINGPKGDVRVMADQNAPAAVGRLLTLNTWEIKHLGELFNMLDMDGATLSRESSADRFEGRIAFYGNMVCYAPGKNMRLVLPS